MSPPPTFSHENVTNTIFSLACQFAVAFSEIQAFPPLLIAYLTYHLPHLQTSLRDAMLVMMPWLCFSCVHEPTTIFLVSFQFALISFSRCTFSPFCGLLCCCVIALNFPHIFAYCSGYCTTIDLSDVNSLSCQQVNFVGLWTRPVGRPLE